MHERSWEFAIDVGGTFTDCLARGPEGEIRRCKWLSSGVAKGNVGAGSGGDRLFDAARRSDPEGFWVGYQVRLLDRSGRAIGQCPVLAFDAATGMLQLERAREMLATAVGYELFSDEEAPLVAIRYLLGFGRNRPLPPLSVRLGTTRGTNALLTRRGARAALAITAGFADLPAIGYQQRPKLFELDIRKPAPLCARAIEIEERIALDGSVLVPLDEAAVERQLRSLQAEGTESLAVCLLNAYAHPVHEMRVAELARRVGFSEISVSHELAPLVGLVPRSDTTVLDAYLNPVIRRYVAQLRQTLGGRSLRVMTSAGGLVEAERFSGKDSILSGPAGGVVGFAQAARAAGFSRAIGFDMGGTSTDVSRFEGQFDLEFQTEKAGVRVATPSLAIHTVAAGGGSICRFDGVKLTVGPDSAGADPGPACYGRGGPLAVTDLNVYLGRLWPEQFPFPLDRKAIEDRLDALASEVAAATGRRYAREELARGLLDIANAAMVQAIRTISVAQGRDPRAFLLVAFGGAAPQHACAVAGALGMRQVLVHREASLLSAYGVGLARLRQHQAKGVYRPLLEIGSEELGNWFIDAERAAHDALRKQGAGDDVEFCRAVELRYQGLDATLIVDLAAGTRSPSHPELARRFSETHRQRYGYLHEHKALELVSVRVEAVAGGEIPEAPATSVVAARPFQPAQMADAAFAAGVSEVALVARGELVSGDELLGPALVYEPHTCTCVDPGWVARLLPGGELLLEDREPVKRSALSEEVDPVQLEIFNRHFAAIAEQMGHTLRNTASSVNVKERLDFSCALFTAEGDLVANAPHIPVHLGAMGQTVRAVLRDNSRLAAGEVIVTNDPYRGGSHLPDITVVTPVHDPETGRLVFFTASRAHHAEIGGVRPGSMPPFSRNLAEEGVLIRNFRLATRGEFHWQALAELLSAGEFPSRKPADNLADLAAQVAANQQGVRDLQALVERHGLAVVTAYMLHIQDAAARKMAAALARLPQGRRTFVDHLDGGATIAVAITLDKGRATIDFTGTSPVLADNLNANRAIVTAAVMYVLRAMIDEDIPLNQGVLRPVELVLPECLLNPPEQPTPEACAAVVGGNVETSQRVVDVLLGALELAAASQGTMNNLLFGDASFGYYETICGGAGATPGAEGASAVHTHMTNTRLTDPEVLEQRFPVRLVEFRIRRGSGGAGAHRGGDGVVRTIEFLKPLEVSLLTQRRGPYAPFGMAGGEPGRLGENTLLRANGAVERLGATAAIEVGPGDRLRIETPGGGGWGAPPEAGFAPRVSSQREEP